MASKKFKLQGILGYNRLDPENPDMGYEGAHEPHGATMLVIDLDQENTDKLARAGSIKQPKPSEENPGMFRVKLERPMKGPFRQAGGPIKVKDADGEPWDFDDGPLIGSGTTAEVMVEVYPTRMKGRNGTRPISLKILELVEYERPDDDEDELEDEPAVQPRSVKETSPGRHKVVKGKPKVPASDIEDDDLPF